VVPSFPSEHPLGGVDLPPSGSPGKYAVDVVLGIPGVSQSVFSEIDWDKISARGDSLIQVPKDVARLTLMLSHRGRNEFSYELGLNDDGRLALAKTCLEASSFREALTNAQSALDSYLSSLSFHHDVPIEAVAWRVTEEQTGAVHLAMKFLGQTQQLDLPPTLLLSTPSRRELFSTWREAMNAATPMAQALSFYKIIDRIHIYRADREARTRNSERHYLPPREVIPDEINLFADYEDAIGSFAPYLGKKFTVVWKEDLRDRIRNAVAHLREDGSSLTADNSVDIGICREAVPLLHYMARIMLLCEISDQDNWREQRETT
jgi:hypothetical protein